MCTKCPHHTYGIVVVVALVVVAVFVGVAVVAYTLSGEVGCARRGGPFVRVLRNIPLQSVKIVIVAWQILTQVGAGASVREMRAQVVGACYFMQRRDFWGLAPDHQPP